MTGGGPGVDRGASIGGMRAAGAARFATSGVPGRGRRLAEAECPTRSPFQRDRDRVLHSTAFRRLIHKTQVFVFHEGDHYRTRLTHSLEVAQIARTMARRLGLDEDLAEALALAHDLGHPPFGHAGERALERVMQAFGGFDHNAQSLRVVTEIERKYFDFDGLNLTWETLEGLAKHNGPAGRGMSEAVAKCARALETGWIGLELERHGSAESQIAAIADDIAYVSHDIDDGLRAGLLERADLESAPLAGEIARELRAARRDEQRLIHEVTRRLIALLIGDIVVETQSRLDALAPLDAENIRAASEAVAAFSADVAAGVGSLKAFLFERVYRSARVMRAMAGAETVVDEIFARYLADGSALPGAWRAAASAQACERRRARIIADFVAGMTDRYALAEHRRLFDATPELR